MRNSIIVSIALAVTVISGVSCLYIQGQNAKEVAVLVQQQEEKEAAEKEVAEKVAAEKEATEKEVAEKVAAEKEATEREATEKEVAEKVAAEKVAAEKEATEKEAAEKEVAEKVAAEKEATEKVAAEKEVAEKEVAEKPKESIKPVEKPKLTTTQETPVVQAPTYINTILPYTYICDGKGDNPPSLPPTDGGEWVWSAIEAEWYLPTIKENNQKDDNQKKIMSTPEGYAAVYESMIALQEQYPEGMPWTNDNEYSWHGGVYNAGLGCAGFAFLLSDTAFGKLSARQHTDFTQIKVGDILRINDDTHSVIVLAIAQDIITIAEGNYNYSIHWGRTLTLDEVKSTGTYVMTRYSE